MKYSSFEELPVWQDAIELTTRAFLLTDDASFRNKGDIANQLQRAALSVSNNIAEGFERGTTAELITFVYYAKGSAGETHNQLYLAADLSYIPPERAGSLRADARPIGGKIYALIRSLGGS